MGGWGRPPQREILSSSSEDRFKDPQQSRRGDISLIRFLHTGDWQLGMTRHFLSEGVQERYTQSRFDAIRKLGRVAKEEGCQFMVVCGDVFESNQVDRKTVSRALEALNEVAVAVYLLPGNHDPLNAASVYRSSTFLERRPAHVHVIENANPIKVGESLEIVGAPWTSKRPLQDLVSVAIEPLETVVGLTRVCVGHGVVDSLSPNPDAPDVISVARVEEALSQGRIHYLALGDRHSVTQVGSSGRIGYAGTPEPTDYDEVKPGFALVVEINGGEITTREVQIGEWRFIERDRIDINTIEELEALRGWIERLENKERTIVKLRLVGSPSLSLHGELNRLITHAQELLAALETRTIDLVMIPEDADFTELGFSGFASGTVERRRAKLEEAGEESISALGALALLLRLARRAE